MNAISSKYPGFFLSNPRLYPQHKKALRHKRKTHKLYVLYLALHAYAVNSTDSPFLQGSRRKSNWVANDIVVKAKCHERQDILPLLGASQNADVARKDPLKKRERERERKKHWKRHI